MTLWLRPMGEARGRAVLFVVKTQLKKRNISLKCRFWWEQGYISGSGVFS